MTLEELFKQAKARWEAMTPLERQAMMQAQRESFARAMQPCEHGVADWENCLECRKGII